MIAKRTSTARPYKFKKNNYITIRIEELGTKWHIRDDKTGKRVLTDKLEIVIIELPKAKRIYKNDARNEISHWMMFLDEPNQREVENIMSGNEEIKKAWDELQRVSGDETLERIAELRLKGARDEMAARAYAENERKTNWNGKRNKRTEKLKLYEIC